MDHAGIATQTKAEAQLKETEGKDRFDYGREEFIDRVWEWKKEYGGKIGGQMPDRDSVDWSGSASPRRGCRVRTIFKEPFDRA